MCMFPKIKSSIEPVTYTTTRRLKGGETHGARLRRRRRHQHPKVLRDRVRRGECLCRLETNTVYRDGKKGM